MKLSRILPLFVLLALSLSAFADRASVEGRVTSMTREGDRYRVALSDSSYTFWVARDIVRDTDLRVDRRVRLSGWVRDGNMKVENVTILTDRERDSGRDRRREEVRDPEHFRRGKVESLNRRLNYLTIRDDESGRYIKIDVRHMDRDRPLRVWDIRPGDRINVRGSWENRDTFDAERIFF